MLLEDGYLNTNDLVEMPLWNPRRIDFGTFYLWKLNLLDKAYSRFCNNKDKKVSAEIEQFKSDNVNWLNDFALFMAIKHAHGGGAWSGWPENLRLRDPITLEEARVSLINSIDCIIFSQYLFFKQWKSVKEYAHTLGIEIIGDIPIFVAFDSSDVWAHQDLFFLDKDGKPSVVAGVPPDYFSPTGQLWGNPLFRWEVHKAHHYDWWLERISSAFNLVDIVRIDHFRGFAAYWEIPGDALTAEHGRWVPGPGAHFFEAIREAKGDLPIIAEDLGLITSDVMQLKDMYSLPGMKVLQFAFSEPNNTFLPHHYSSNYIVYTGTHDNDTTCGWFEKASTEEMNFAQKYLHRGWKRGEDFCWDVIRMAWSSVAKHAIVPLQDFLMLGSEARFNYPSTLGGNWVWRFVMDDLSGELQNRIKELNWLYCR